MSDCPGEGRRLSCVVCLFVDKDWEDLRKMPEHPTLVKEFKKNRLVCHVHLLTYLCHLSLSTCLNDASEMCGCQNF